MNATPSIWRGFAAKTWEVVRGGLSVYLSYSHLFLRCISLSRLPGAGRSAPASQSQTGPERNNAVLGEMLIQCLIFFLSFLLLLYWENAARCAKNKGRLYGRARAHVFPNIHNST